jgi:hypothetical protein
MPSWQEYLVSPVAGLIDGSGHVLIADNDPQKRKWPCLFDSRQGNNLGAGGFLEDFAGTVVLKEPDAETIGVYTGLRVNILALGKPRGQFQIRDIAKQPAGWTCTLASPNQ